jgi:hypothetical protein
VEIGARFLVVEIIEVFHAVLQSLLGYGRQSGVGRKDSARGQQAYQKEYLKRGGFF